MKLRHITEARTDFPDLKSAISAVKQYGWRLQLIPDKFKSPKVCHFAVMENGKAIRHVPKKWKRTILNSITINKMSDMDIRRRVIYALRDIEFSEVVTDEEYDSGEINEYSAYDLTSEPDIDKIVTAIRARNATKAIQVVYDSVEQEQEGGLDDMEIQGKVNNPFPIQFPDVFDGHDVPFK